jgi:DNA-binding winged helix-turn-helix (wHTH) protein/tetratricopeptide (TPR) repeat protein/TolB-like protein
LFRFSGFALDHERAILRGPDGETIKLRPKTFDMLWLFATNPRRILSKQELMDAIWPNVRIGEDGLFQCIREIRTALGDGQRQLVRLVSGRGYIFDVDVTAEPNGDETTAELADLAPADFVAPKATPANATHARSFRAPTRRFWALAPVAGLGAILAVAVPFVTPHLVFKPTLPTIMVMPIGTPDHGPRAAAMAAGVTERLVDGLARIDGISVVLPPPHGLASAAPATSAPSRPTDYVISAELRKREHAWTLETRLVKTATGIVVPVESPAVDINDADPQLEQSRLAAALGHPLALRLNELIDSGARPATGENDAPLGNAKVVIGQAIASINQTSRERFSAAQTMLEKALAEDGNNPDIAVALASLQLRGIQLVWYSPADAAIAEKNAMATLKHALKTRPNYTPVLESYCRFLTATNQFVEGLVACARVLSFDPWNGLALYHTGLIQVQLGRFDDALAAFKQADRFDTPRVSRWTWLLGAGLTDVVMGRYQEALPWLQRSIAITPGSGRTYMLLAAAYQQLGRSEEAKAALARGMALRPGSTADNISLPTKNASPVYLNAAKTIISALVDIGLPAH